MRVFFISVHVKKIADHLEKYIVASFYCRKNFGLLRGQIAQFLMHQQLQNTV